MAADWDKQAGRPGASKEGVRSGQAARPPTPVSASTEPIPLTSAVTQPPMPGGPTLEVGERLANRFTIFRFIARGGMGAVYEAEDTVLRTRVAVKTILPEFAADPTAMERFRREVLLARRVTHMNICRMFELYEAVDARGERLNFLTMELLLGETLAQRLTRTGPMASYELFVLLRQPNLHEAEGASRFFFGCADAQQQLIALGQTLPHGSQFAQQTRQPLAPHGDLLGLPAAAFGQHIEFA